ncbi:hypothetical protein T484DRAFT_1923484 [Baffinella frigidus]|nr:hypothetical protein T484DRAFT_1923484 [Cryptophyta sp. CCMP2293]
MTALAALGMTALAVFAKNAFPSGRTAAIPAALDAPPPRAGPSATRSGSRPLRGAGFALRWTPGTLDRSRANPLPPAPRGRGSPPAPFAALALPFALSWMVLRAASKTATRASFATRATCTSSASRKRSCSAI